MAGAEEAKLRQVCWLTILEYPQVTESLTNTAIEKS